MEAALRAVESTERDYECGPGIIGPHHGPRDKRFSPWRDLPRVWHAETTTNADRNHLLRFVVRRSLSIRNACGESLFQINWQTGASSEMRSSDTR